MSFVVCSALNMHELFFDVPVRSCQSLVLQVINESTALIKGIVRIGQWKICTKKLFALEARFFVITSEKNKQELATTY